MLATHGRRRMYLSHAFSSEHEGLGHAGSCMRPWRSAGIGDGMACGVVRREDEALMTTSKCPLTYCADDVHSEGQGVER